MTLAVAAGHDREFPRSLWNCHFRWILEFSKSRIENLISAFQNWIFKNPLDTPVELFPDVIWFNWYNFREFPMTKSLLGSLETDHLSNSWYAPKYSQFSSTGVSLKTRLSTPHFWIDPNLTRLGFFFLWSQARHKKIISSSNF